MYVQRIILIITPQIYLLLIAVDNISIGNLLTPINEENEETEKKKVSIVSLSCFEGINCCHKRQFRNIFSEMSIFHSFTIIKNTKKEKEKFGLSL
jgi:hypothetical protein